VFVRFVVEEIDPDSGVEQGIVQAIYRLWRSGALSVHEEAWWEEIRAWLNVDLEAPDRLARSRRPGANACAISWFKASATDHIARARELASLLAQHDIRSRMLTTDRPGYVVYEDEFQVVAEPFRRELR
jgi:hypothetical protein